MNKSIIKTVNISKEYKKKNSVLTALKNVSIEINKGDFISIMGPSGAGKTTLAQILGCIDTPTSGKVYFNGDDISEMDDIKLSLLRASKIGFIFQSFNLINGYSVLENVKLPFFYSNIKINKNEEVEKRAIEVIESVGLFERINHNPNELSGGEQQRVAIARSIITDPDIIFADEPTGNLDTKTGSEIFEILLELNKNGKTIILITHNPKLAKIAKKNIYIKDGMVEI